MTTQLKIEGMTCKHCIRAANEALLRVPFVAHATVDLESGTATVEHDGASVEAMIAELKVEGFDAKES